ncbi:MAG: single-stranded DNA-binding protein [Patescibacteria group bacterium]|jgi:single-strand DNA-binding protein
MDLNRILLIGHVAKDPEQRTVNKTTVTNFHLATNRIWKNPSKETKEKAEFHSIVGWGKLSEIMKQYVHKGDKVLVEGRVVYRNAEDKDGKMHYFTDIIAERLMLLSSKPTETVQEITEEPF